MSLNHWDAPNGSYTAAIPPGTAAFRKVVGEHFGYARTEVVRDRSRCAGQKSEHCECGAIDFFTTDFKKGRTLFDWCVAHAEELGIQSVIFYRRVVGFGDARERQYTGPSPHTDHVHVGLNRSARRSLTVAQVLEHIEGVEDLANVPQKEWDQMKKDVAAVKKALYKKDEEHLNVIEKKLDELLARG